MFFYCVIDKNYNSRTSPSVNIVVPLVRKPLTTSTPSKGTPQNRRLNSGEYFFIFII